MVQGESVETIAREIGAGETSLYRLRDNISEWFKYQDKKERERNGALTRRVDRLEKSRPQRVTYLEGEIARLKIALSRSKVCGTQLRRELELRPPEPAAFVRRARVELPDSLPPPGSRKPSTREDCEPGGHNGNRPCAWSSCFYHLDSNLASCTLDVAARGTNTLEEIGDIFGLTRERIRQIERAALDKLARRFGKGLIEFLE